MSQAEINKMRHQLMMQGWNEREIIKLIDNAKRAANAKG